MRGPIIVSVRALLVVSVLCGVLYPVVVTAAAQWLADDRATGRSYAMPRESSSVRS